jgi:uncharacterized membrane protein
MKSTKRRTVAKPALPFATLAIRTTAAIATTLALICELAFNIEAHPGIDATGLAAIALPILAASVCFLGEIIGGTKRWLMLAAAVGLMSISVANSYSRMDLATNTAWLAGQNTNEARQRAEAALKRAIGEQSDIAATITRECFSSRPGPICKAAKPGADDAVAKAQAKADAMPAAVATAAGVGSLAADAGMSDDLVGADRTKHLLFAVFLNLVPLLALQFMFFGKLDKPALREDPSKLRDDEIRSRTLEALKKLGGKAESQKALVEASGLHKSCVSRGAVLLEQRGIIRRHRDGKRVSLAIV